MQESANDRTFQGDFGLADEVFEYQSCALGSPTPIIISCALSISTRFDLCWYFFCSTIVLYLYQNELS